MSGSITSRMTMSGWSTFSARRPSSGWTTARTTKLNRPRYSTSRALSFSSSSISSTRTPADRGVCVVDMTVVPDVLSMMKAPEPTAGEVHDNKHQNEAGDENREDLHPARRACRVAARLAISDATLVALFATSVCRQSLRLIDRQRDVHKQHQ